MNKEVLFIAPLTILLLAAGGAALAAPPGGGDAAKMPNGPSATQTPSQNSSPSVMSPGAPQTGKTGKS